MDKEKQLALAEALYEKHLDQSLVGKRVITESGIKDPDTGEEFVSAGMSGTVVLVDGDGDPWVEWDEDLKNHNHTVWSVNLNFGETYEVVEEEV